MDSRGSESPMQAPVAPLSGTGTPTSRPTEADVTRRRPAVEIPELSNVERQPDGSWRDVDKLSAAPITAVAFERLELIGVSAAHLAHTLRGRS